MLPGFLIREMQSGDLTFAASCTAAEGWVSEDQATLEGFFLNNPKGCLLAEQSEQPVGICIATHYGNSGFIGELIVRPEARGKGVGAALLNHGVAILRSWGAETIYLDGVLKAVALYERNGFHKVCRSWRFSGHLDGILNRGVRQMVPSDLYQVAALDKVSFGEERGYFLRRRFELFPELSYVMLERQSISGYILGRAGTDWLSAGPWVVSGDTATPLELLNAFALAAEGRQISLGILDSNRAACVLVQSLGFTARTDSPWRMALGPSSDLGASQYCYAIGSAAKG